MNKTCVVYYSCDGNTAFVADEIKKTLKCDVVEIKPLKRIPQKGFFKYFIGGMQTFRKMRPKLQKYDFKHDKYDLIIIGTPVWASNMAAPIYSFLKNTEFTGKKVALYCCFGGNEGKTLVAINDMLEIHNNTIISKKGFRSPLKDINKAAKEINAWIEELQ